MPRSNQFNPLFPLGNNLNHFAVSREGGAARSSTTVPSSIERAFSDTVPPEFDEFQQTHTPQEVRTAEITARAQEIAAIVKRVAEQGRRDIQERPFPETLDLRAVQDSARASYDPKGLPVLDAEIVRLAVPNQSTRMNNKSQPHKAETAVLTTISENVTSGNQSDFGDESSSDKWSINTNSKPEVAVAEPEAAAIRYTKEREIILKQINEKKSSRARHLEREFLEICLRQAEALIKLKPRYMDSRFVVSIANDMVKLINERKNSEEFRTDTTQQRVKHIKGLADRLYRISVRLKAHNFYKLEKRALQNAFIPAYLNLASVYATRVGKPFVFQNGLMAKWLRYKLRKSTKALKHKNSQTQKTASPATANTVSEQKIAASPQVVNTRVLLPTIQKAAVKKVPTTPVERTSNKKRYKSLAAIGTAIAAVAVALFMFVSQGHKSLNDGATEAKAGNSPTAAQTATPQKHANLSSGASSVLTASSHADSHNIDASHSPVVKKSSHIAWEFITEASNTYKPGCSDAQLNAAIIKLDKAQESAPSGTAAAHQAELSSTWLLNVSKYRANHKTHLTHG